MKYEYRRTLDELNAQISREFNGIDDALLRLIIEF